jgi:uncharacterized membrane-anchored protein
MSKFAFVAALLTLAVSGVSQAQDPNDAKLEEFRAKLRALDWVKGPRAIDIAGNSTLSLPEGFVYLDAANTAKFEELNENLSDGKEVMIAPKTLRWSAYLVFDDDGYVKDDDKIDADAILKTLKDNTEAANEERRRRGWPELHVSGWSIPPAYNATTKRLEWATLLQWQGGQSTNFFTKVLGRRGVTTVILVSAPENTSTAVADLNGVLTGYRFKQGDMYADYRPGDKIAEYGLTGLIVGGAVAAAVKTGLLKGLWKFLVAGVAAFWKLIVAAAVAGMAGLRSLFKRKQPAA